MPYFIAVYDINQKRVGKMLKIFRKYLNWVQNSVFEGELTRAQFVHLQSEIHSTMDKDVDSIIFYELRTERYAERKVIGQERGNRSNIL